MIKITKIAKMIRGGPHLYAVCRGRVESGVEFDTFTTLRNFFLVAPQGLALPPVDSYHVTGPNVEGRSAWNVAK